MGGYNLKITSGVVIGSAPRAPGFVALDVPEKLARQLLERGKAELATEEDLAGIDTGEDDGPVLIEGQTGEPESGAGTGAPVSNAPAAAKRAGKKASGAADEPTKTEDTE